MDNRTPNQAVTRQNNVAATRVSELKIDFGPGYRVYFGQDGNKVILLGGGDKGSQVDDIRKAKERWRDYHDPKDQQLP